MEPKERKNTGNMGKGRPKGALNKSTALLKDAVLRAAELAGGEGGLVGYLARQAEESPAAFMSLLGRIIPMDVNTKGSVTINIIGDDAKL